MEQVKKIFTQMQNKLIKNVENLSAYVIETDSSSNPNMPNNENCNESNENDNIVVTNDVNVVKKKSNIKQFILFLILFVLFICVLLNVYDNVLCDDNFPKKQDGGFELRNEILNIDLSA